MIEGTNMEHVSRDTSTIPSGWELVALGIAAPRSHFCVCCLTFEGTGLLRHSLSYCLPCWHGRQVGAECSHALVGATRAETAAA